MAILLNNDYHKERLKRELKKIYPKILTKIRIKLPQNPRKTEKIQVLNLLIKLEVQIGLILIKSQCKIS